MPLYTRQIRVPAQTAESNAVRIQTEVDERVITEAEVFIDTGSNGEVNVVVLDGESRILPERAGDPISKPETTGPVPLAYELPGVPGQVTIKAWAPDADFEHEVIVNFETRAASRANPLQRLVETFRSGGTARPASRIPPEQ
jgi:hypothetical protein